MKMFKDSCGVGFIADLTGAPSYSVLRDSLKAVKNLTHRGAALSDGRTGDGSGIMFQIPHEFFIAEAKRINPSFSADRVVVGAFFLKEDKKSLDLIEREAKSFFKDAVLREVPVDDRECGEIARSSMPLVYQLIAPAGKSPLEIYAFRRKLEKALRDINEENYVVSLSDSLVVYKGMLLAPDLDRFYKDLKNEELATTFAVFHQRYSTNTNPEWKLAQPLRFIAHNGEINTITANRNFLRTVEPILGISQDLLPLLEEGESDSASLDKVFELMILYGIPPHVAVNVLVPPAFTLMDEVDEKVMAFFEYAAFFMKPWDGPAAIAFTDGKVVGAKLDRNGLRPARFLITEDGRVIFGSEVGMVEVPEGKLLESKRLQPGETLLVDPVKGEIKENEEILKEIAFLFDVSKEVRRKLCVLKGEFCEPENNPNLTKEMIKFGYFREELENVIEYAGEMGKEPVFSMGDDTPIPNFRKEPPLLFSYFKQRFAQVTNPPIDPIRERAVMSLSLRLGPKAGFLDLDGKLPRRIKIDSPLLTPSQFKKLLNASFLKTKMFKMEFNPKEGLKKGLNNLFESVVEAVKKGEVDIVILSDKEVEYPIPSLLAVSGLCTRLEREKLLHRISLAVETGEARNSHHIAALVAFGAAAVYPYLVFEYFKSSVLELNKSYEELERNYVKAVNDGLLKIMSKMGISLVSSYHLSKLFDAVGLSQELVDEFFPGVFSPIGGITLREIENAVVERVKRSRELKELPWSGEYKYRPDGNVSHGWNPEVVRNIFKAAKSGDYEDFKKVVDATQKEIVYIRDVLKIDSDREPIPLEEVEPIESIVRRLMVPGMSVGALSKEAHEVIAEALNILGSKSCSGEGGEDPSRYGTIKNSKIKQVASGRFGVTPAYLASAEEIEIKIAQGAKPGEGGHLPGHKVTPYIASLRHSVPGVALISPPPHHDIYSIEDLAQLIHDLKLSNPEAKIAVKLVAERGVGTVACGVAKAKADIVQISGGDGGTGASPLTSIKGAGLPWEVGLAETQRELIENGLRDRVVLRVDGGFKTGRDVVVAALMGAEEFGFGTAAMIAEGCVMDRDCHTNRCPVGIATQDERRIKRFRGAVKTVVNYFRLVAEDVRRILSQMGYRSLDEIIGRVDLLKVDEEKLSRLPYRGKVNFDFILNIPVYPASKAPYNPVVSSLNEEITADVLSTLSSKGKFLKVYEIKNTDRSVGVLLAYALTKEKYELSEGSVRLVFKGTAGQSFGAFLPRGVVFELEGIANDYVAKGLAGGVVALRFPARFRGEPTENVIAGNTVLYGATGGALYAAGMVGERFAVRNSGAVAVVEGVGKHGCEYMVRGIVVVAGSVGKNFGAGMTGGVAYVLDRELEEKINKDYVEVRKLDQRDLEVLKILLSRHYKFTKSRMAEVLLENRFLLESFRKVVPIGVKELELKLSGAEGLPE